MLTRTSGRKFRDRDKSCINLVVFVRRNRKGSVKRETRACCWNRFVVQQAEAQATGHLEKPRKWSSYWLKFGMR